jgi:hypothetical protein
MNTQYNSETDTLKYPFKGSDKITNNFSQAYQDLFALTMLNGKTGGKYLEIGANEPVCINNTFLLEDKFNWTGTSVEIDNELVQLFNSIRTNKCECADATKFDYQKKMKSLKWKTTQIDYASIDCEPAMTTLAALKKLPHDTYRFSVITYENDVYKDGPESRELSRELLQGLGYQLVAADVCNGGNPYEDWYVDPQVVSEKVWKNFESVGAEARTLFVCQ